MASLRGRRYLKCFYCGCRSETRYDGVIREFRCRNCEATNYLDEKGEITDPPVATTTATSSSQYAIPRSQSPDAGPSKDIFCSTCLKNQHLFTSSLAQYFPDNPDAPDYPELEKNYYKFRRGLEERYPQICEECEPKVFLRLQAAGYQAKTDHLRRMMDKTRANRQTPKQWTYLDLINTVGKWIWLGGLGFEYLWHLSSISDVLRADGMQLGEGSWMLAMRDLLFQLAERLPAKDRLIALSFWSNILTVWWNPLFVQVFRGFSRHILGLGQWYTFQALMIFVRIVFSQVSTLSIGQRTEKYAQITAHLFMAGVMSLMYVLAGRSVRVDTTSLFGSSHTISSPSRPKATPKVRSTKNLSNILDEILSTPVSQPKVDAISPERNSVLSGSIFQSRDQALEASPSLQIGSLGLSDAQPQNRAQELQYSEEMDWSPTQSPYRAFNDFGTTQRQAQGFGRTPVDPNPGPFWYKVPPAPTNPARQLRNPSGRPVLLSKPAEQEQNFFGRSDGWQTKETNRETVDGDVEFRSSKYFAPPDPKDPRNSLADLLSQSFNLNQDEERDDSQQSSRSSRSKALPRFFGLRSTRLVDGLMLILMLVLWTHTAATHYLYHMQMLLGIMCICITVALRVTTDTLMDMRQESAVQPAPIIGACLGLGQSGAAVHLALQVWGSGGECASCESQGIWLIGTMIAHQFWNAVL